MRMFIMFIIGSLMWLYIEAHLRWSSLTNSASMTPSSENMKFVKLLY